MRWLETALLLGFALAVMLGSTAAFAQSRQEVADSVLRLHVVANSDSAEDQAVKLKVRDAILEKVGERLSADSKEECREEIINNLDEIEKIANDTLKENGFSYTAYVQYGKFEFPKKTYKSMTLPAGEYYGVRVVLGSGNGQNWWCVMYPPMCLAEDGEVTLSKQNEEILRENLDENTYDIITKENNEVVVKFKIVEMVQGIKQKINGD